LLLRRLRADAHEDHLAPGVLLLQAKRLLDGDLVEGVHHPLDAVGGEAGALGVDLELRLGIRDALHGDENLHGGVSSGGIPNRTRFGTTLAHDSQAERRRWRSTAAEAPASSNTTRRRQIVAARSEPGCYLAFRNLTMAFWSEIGRARYAARTPIA